MPTLIQSILRSLDLHILAIWPRSNSTVPVLHLWGLFEQWVFYQWRWLLVNLYKLWPLIRDEGQSLSNRMIYSPGPAAVQRAASLDVDANLFHANSPRSCRPRAAGTAAMDIMWPACLQGLEGYCRILHAYKMVTLHYVRCLFRDK